MESSVEKKEQKMQLDKDQLGKGDREWGETTPYAAQMTKREKFAGQIMASMLSAMQVGMANDQQILSLARLAVRCADHLLSELQ